MPWSTGSDVVVRVLGNKRGTIVATGRNGHYRVRVDGVTVACREEDLAAPPEGGKKKAAGQKREDVSTTSSVESAVPCRVDLHGLRVDEAIARVVDEIDRALLLGADRLEVVHGRGTGRIRDAVQRHLGSMSVVASFKRDPSNPGVTWVYFR